jgi:hypothetical protein
MRRYVWTCSLLALLLVGVGCRNLDKTPEVPKLDSKKYYAVLLSNGSVYFGQLEGFGSPYPVLTDVYYVASNVNKDTKEVNNALVKRGKEWHGPDRMILNEKNIVFIEPVGLDSRVAKLIEESKK